MTLGNLMEEAGDDQDPSVSEIQDSVDRALSDAGRRADSVPAAVVEAAKEAYEQRGRVTGAAEPSAEDETTEPSGAGAARRHDLGREIVPGAAPRRPRAALD